MQKLSSSSNSLAINSIGFLLETSFNILDFFSRQLTFAIFIVCFLLCVCVCVFFPFLFQLHDCSITYKCLYGDNSVYKFTQIGAHCILFMLLYLICTLYFFFLSISVRPLNSVVRTSSTNRAMAHRVCAFFSSFIFCLLCTSTKIWLLTCQNRSNHQCTSSTHM